MYYLSLTIHNNTGKDNILIKLLIDLTQHTKKKSAAHQLETTALYEGRQYEIYKCICC